MEILKKIESFAGRRNLLISFSLIILCSLGMGFLESSIPGARLKKLDFRAFYTLAEIQSVFTSYGESGRRIYLYMNVVDMIFPVALAFFSAGLFAKSTSGLNLPKILGLLPAGFLLFDTVENLLIFYYLFAWPEISAWVARFGGVVTTIKLVFLGICFLYIILSVPLFLYRFRAGSRPPFFN